VKFAVFSDIHANLTALQACYNHFIELNKQAKIVILGDYINYGPRPNETIAFIQKISPYIVLCGNHEKALSGSEDARFSSQRGIESLMWTRKMLNNFSRKFIGEHEKNYWEEDADGRKMLFIHGDLSDVFWGKMPFAEMQRKEYKIYDFVVSGHTHIPHLVEVFYETENPTMRYRKKTVFLNPGSVGQPRNHCKYAQYMMLDTETEEFEYYKAPYDISLEQNFFEDSIDTFYKERLNSGI
jgi:putative phosphoesterase